jgi:hypothetical protein
MNLFRGVELTSLTTFIPSIIYLTIYDSAMNNISFYIHEHSNKDSFKLIFPLFISAVAQSITLMTYLPIDLIRIRVQVIAYKLRWSTNIHPSYLLLMIFGKKKESYAAINHRSYTSFPEPCLLHFNFKVSKWYATLQGLPMFGWCSILSSQLQ